MRKFTIRNTVCIVISCIALLAGSVNITKAAILDIYGSVKDGVYSNHVINVRAEFDQNWIIHSQKEIKKQIEELISASQSLKSEDVNTDEEMIFAVEARDKTSSIAISLTQMGAILPSLPKTSSKEMIERILYLAEETWPKKLHAAYSELSGSENVEIEFKRQTFNFAGSNYPGFNVIIWTDKMSIYQRILYILKDDYYYNIVVASHGVDITDNLLKMFKKLYNTD